MLTDAGATRSWLHDDGWAPMVTPSAARIDTAWLTTTTVRSTPSASSASSPRRSADPDVLDRLAAGRPHVRLACATARAGRASAPRSARTVRPCHSPKSASWKVASVRTGRPSRSAMIAPVIWVRTIGEAITRLGYGMSPHRSRPTRSTRSAAACACRDAGLVERRTGLARARSSRARPSWSSARAGRGRR